MDLLIQIKSSMLDLNASYIDVINQLIILVGVLSGLIYFFFSKEHTGVIGKISRLGVYFLMIKFGASFGFAVMGRVSLLIGRFEELILYSRAEYYFASPAILLFILVVLGIWSLKDRKYNNESTI